MPKKKKSDTVMGFSLIVAIFVIGFFSYAIFVQYGSEFEKFGGDLSENEKNLKIEWDSCVKEKSSEGFNIEYSKDVCYLNVKGLSIVENDCNNFINLDLKDFCYMRIALRDLNVDFCSKISLERRNNCYFILALKLENSLVCENIDSSEKIVECKNQFN